MEGFQVGWETLEVGARADAQTNQRGVYPRAGITGDGACTRVLESQEMLWESCRTELGSAAPPWKGRQSLLGPVPDSNCEDGLCIHIEINKDLVMRSLWTWEDVRVKQREI